MWPAIKMMPSRECQSFTTLWRSLCWSKGYGRQNSAAHLSFPHSTSSSPPPDGKQQQLSPWRHLHPFFHNARRKINVCGLGAWMQARACETSSSTSSSVIMLRVDCLFSAYIIEIWFGYCLDRCIFRPHFSFLSLTNAMVIAALYDLHHKRNWKTDWKTEISYGNIPQKGTHQTSKFVKETETCLTP